MAAKLLHSVLLCSDINLKTLISITVDDEGILLITCKSFIKRFCLSDRKQVNSWITNSWHPFTTGAVKDPKSGKISCIINRNIFCQWDIEESNIENVKKYSFKSSINQLLQHGEDIYVVFDCGVIETLTAALKTRKETKTQILREKETILNAAVVEENGVRIPLMATEKGDQNHCLYKFHQDSSKMPQNSVDISLPNHQLLGVSILSSGKLLTVWSDGNMYLMNALDPTSIQIPGSRQGSLNFFKCTKKIKILELSDTHIALQGMDSNEDGGLVVLWDTKFEVSVSTKPMKMYRDPPLAWNVESGIVIADGGALVYIPVTLAPSTVASMFASKIAENSAKCDECVGWKSTSSGPSGIKNFKIPATVCQTIYSNKSGELSQVVRSVSPGSVSEDVVASLVISHLSETRNLQLLLESLKQFKIIPEKSLVTILKFMLQTPNEEFESVLGINFMEDETKKNRRKNRDINVKLLAGLSSNNDESDRERRIQVLTPQFCETKEKVVNQVLMQPFSEKQLFAGLHQMGFACSWTLIQYLHYLLATGKAQIVEEENDDVPSIDEISRWLSLMLDANYHQLVMTSELDIHRRLLDCLQDISNMLNFLESSNSIDPLVERVLHFQEIPVTASNAPYSIERLVIS